MEFREGDVVWSSVGLGFPKWPCKVIEIKDSEIANIQSFGDDVQFRKPLKRLIHFTNNPNLVTSGKKKLKKRTEDSKLFQKSLSLAVEHIRKEKSHKLEDLLDGILNAMLDRTLDSSLDFSLSDSINDTPNIMLQKKSSKSICSTPIHTKNGKSKTPNSRSRKLRKTSGKNEEVFSSSEPLDILATSDNDVPTPHRKRSGTGLESENKRSCLESPSVDTFSTDCLINMDCSTSADPVNSSQEPLDSSQEPLDSSQELLHSSQELLDSSQEPLDSTKDSFQIPMNLSRVISEDSLDFSQEHKNSSQRPMASSQGPRDTSHAIQTFESTYKKHNNLTGNSSYSDVTSLASKETTSNNFPDQKTPLNNVKGLECNQSLSSSSGGSKITRNENIGSRSGVSKNTRDERSGSVSVSTFSSPPCSPKDSDSDDDLPPFNFGSDSTPKPGLLKPNDIIWVKHQSFPHWPALVVDVQKKKRNQSRASVYFLGGEDRTPMFVGSQKAIATYTYENREKLRADGIQDLKRPGWREMFELAVKEADSLLQMRVNKEIEGPPSAQYQLLIQKRMKPLTPSSIRSPIQQGQHCETPRPTTSVFGYDIGSIQKDLFGSGDKENSSDSEGEWEDYEEEEDDNSPYCYAKVIECFQKNKSILQGISKGEIKSELHQTYVSGLKKTKEKMKYMEKYGPAKNMPDSKKQKLIEFLQETAKVAFGGLLNFPYAYDVLLPEAMVRTIRFTEKCTLDEAWMKLSET